MFVKICGITNESDALLAVALGADALGFVFAPSPRQINERRVGAILAQLPSEILTFGLFVNELPKRVVAVVHDLGLRGAQLHGNESVADVREVAERVPLVIKAVPAGIGIFDRVSQYQCWAILVDSPQPGSGVVFDWALIDGIPPLSRLIVAGGLTPDNVAQAIETVHPFGVDVSSGVEARPGYKDPVALRNFIERAKRAGALEEPSVDGASVFDIEGGR
ncbi:MAG: phosphoribosylanthranilate isomerase [Ferrimicrobium sp.]